MTDPALITALNTYVNENRVAAYLMMLDDPDLNYIIYSKIKKYADPFKILMIDQHIPFSGISTTISYITKFTQIYVPYMKVFQQNYANSKEFSHNGPGVMMFDNTAQEYCRAGRSCVMVQVSFGTPAKKAYVPLAYANAISGGAYADMYVFDPPSSANLRLPLWGWLYTYIAVVTDNLAQTTALNVMCNQTKFNLPSSNPSLSSPAAFDIDIVTGLAKQTTTDDSGATVDLYHDTATLYGVNFKNFVKFNFLCLLLGDAYVYEDKGQFGSLVGKLAVRMYDSAYATASPTLFQNDYLYGLSIAQVISNETLYQSIKSSIVEKSPAIYAPTFVNTSAIPNPLVPYSIFQQPLNMAENAFSFTGTANLSANYSDYVKTRLSSPAIYNTSLTQLLLALLYTAAKVTNVNTYNPSTQIDMLGLIVAWYYQLFNTTYLSKTTVSPALSTDTIFSQSPYTTSITFSSLLLNGGMSEFNLTDLAKNHGGLSAPTSSSLTTLFSQSTNDVDIATLLAFYSQCQLDYVPQSSSSTTVSFINGKQTLYVACTNQIEAMQKITPSLVISSGIPGETYSFPSSFGNLAESSDSFHPSYGYGYDYGYDFTTPFAWIY